MQLKTLDYYEIQEQVNRLLDLYVHEEGRQVAMYYGDDAFNFIVIVFFALQKKWPLVIIPPDKFFFRHAIQDTSVLLFTGLDVPAVKTGHSQLQQIPAEADFIIYTSGTTGTPVGVMVNVASFIENKKDFNAFLPIDQWNKYAVCTSVFTSYGLNVGLLQPLLMRKQVCVYDFIHPNTLLTQLMNNTPRCLVTNPAVIRQLLPFLPVLQQLKDNGLECIISSGAMLPEDCFHALCLIPGLIIADSYGASETGGIGLKLNDFNTPFRRMPSVTMQVREAEEGQLLWVKGVKNMIAYRANEHLTRQKKDEGYVYTGDIIVQVNDDEFYIKGRSSALFKIHGKRVQAELVEQYLEQVPGVKDAWIYGEVHPMLGEKLCAEVVLYENAKETPVTLITKLSAALPAYMVPRKIAIVESIKTNNGKKVRRMLL